MITLLDPFALQAPSQKIMIAGFGLVEKDLPCPIMTIIAGVDLGSLCNILGFFPFEF